MSLLNHVLGMLCVFTYLHAWHAYVLGVFTCLCAYMLGMLTCLHAYVLGMFMCLCAYVLGVLACVHVCLL